MSFHPREHQRVARLRNFDEATGGKYCWTDLATLAMYRHDAMEAFDRKDAARNTTICIEDSKSSSEGRCYCGKFENGEVKKIPVEEGVPNEQSN